MVEPSFSVDLAATGVKVGFSDERVEPAALSAELVDSLKLAVRATLEGEGVVAASVDVFVVSTNEIARLNAEHMGVDGPTDVLSFPLDDPSEGEGFGFTPHAGDIVVAFDVAEAQAADHAGSIEAELHLLLIHSALHLLGHDHAVDAEREAMQALEAKYLAGFGFDHPGDQR